MSATDHLAGGLVQLGLVVAAAWAYPRVRAGARAALALLFGFFGVLAGTEALYYTFADSPSGDDFTGLLSLARRLRPARDRRRHALAGTAQRTTAAAAGTSGVASSSPGASLLVGVVLFPTAIAYVVTHTARAAVPAPTWARRPKTSPSPQVTG